MENIKLAVIINEEVYELVKYTHCRDCAIKDFVKCGNPCIKIKCLLKDDSESLMLKKVENEIH